MPAEPAAGPAAFAAASAAPRPARARVALLAAGGALILAAVVFIAGELGVARVPEQRAALEELIRRETGLDVSFSALSVRWGWYGLEAVFHGVVLGEPAGGGALLRAPRLVVGLDTWRMVRSGHLEAGRITLESPDIDLRAAAGGAAGPQALPAAAARADLLRTGARILSRWRGGRIDIEGGTLRGLPARGGPAVELTVRHAQLRRLGDEWNADALVLLPESLGSSAHVALRMQGDPMRLQDAGGTLSLEGRRLEFAGWRALAGEGVIARYLPQAGSGNLELRAAFAGAQLLRADGRIHAAGIEWAAPSAQGTPLALERLRALWQLERRGSEWRLSVDAPDAGAAAGPITLHVSAAADGAYVHGQVQHAAVALLAGLARWYAPQLPLGELAFGGQARELTFDWSAHGPAGARLITAADLEDLTLSAPVYGVRVSGLAGHVSGADERLVVDLESQAARLDLARAPQPLSLDALGIAARLALDTTGGRWRLSTEDLEVRRAQQTFAASGVITAAPAGATPRMSAHLAVKEADVPLLAELLSPRALATLGSAAAHLTAGRIESADVAWNGPLDGTAPWNLPGAGFTGAVVLRGARFNGDELWPDADGIDAHIDWRGSHVRVAASLGGVQLRALTGLPPIGALHGTLSFAGGHLQRSKLTGQWLGGPVSLAVSEQRKHRLATLSIAGRGVLDARHAVLAAGADTDVAELAGNAEWSALLTYLPAADAQPHWRLRADSSLAGVASRLPEPFAKAAGAALPLHLEVQGAGADAQLQLTLGERLAALASLTRSAEVWRIERGAVRLGGAGSVPALPAERVLLVDGRLSRLDLAACLAWWRQAGRDPALPELRAHLAAAQLLAGVHSYTQASLGARVTRDGATLELESAEVSGRARWPTGIDGGHPAVVELGSFDIAQPGDAALAAALADVLAPAAELAIGDLQWQGRSLGRLTASLAARGEGLEVSALHLSGASGDTQGSAQCAADTCRARLSLESRDAAATLIAFGLRPDVSARHARLEGELEWSPAAPMPLATLDGHLHMQLEQGSVQAAPQGGGMPFALLSVPALVAGMNTEIAPGPTLHFAGLTANYQLHAGEARTADLHFDGDAEILLRGHVGLIARDYDEQAWILNGEQRLPEAVRRLGPTPRVAAVWLSLRELFAGAATERARAALHLRGTWNDPIVTPAE